MNDAAVYRELADIRQKLGELTTAVSSLARHVETQNGRIGKNEDRLDEIESARLAEAAVRAAMEAQQRESRARRFAWIAAAGSLGGLITGGITTAANVLT